MGLCPKLRLATIITAWLSLLFPLDARAYRTASDVEEYAGTGPVRFPTGVIRVRLNDRMPPGIGVADAESALAAARSAWSGPACSALSFRYEGVTSRPASSGDGITTVEWLLSGWVERGFSPDAAGTTDVRWERDPSGRWSITDADVYLNGQYFDWHIGTAGLDSDRDVQAVLTHELGHCGGLWHPCEIHGEDGAPTCDESYAGRTMHPIYSASQRVLSEDDVAGICFLYPAETCETAGCPEGYGCTDGACRPLCGAVTCRSGETCQAGSCVRLMCGPDCAPATCTSATDCTPGMTCIDGTCAPSPGTAGDPCADASECARSQCTADGYCSVACTADGSCPEGYACDVATGLCGAVAGVFGDGCDTSSACVSGVCLASSAGDSKCSRACEGPGAFCPDGWSCGSVDTRFVCRPQATSGCSIGGSGSGTPWWMGFAFLLPVCFLRRRRRALSGAVLALLLSACGGGREEGNADAGPAGPGDAAADARAIDAEPTPDAGTEPDAGPEPCDDPATMRTVPCGSCGLASQRCGDDGFWEPAGACLGEGECAPGAVETETTALCGERSRICDDMCAWRPWTETVPGTGECEPGDVRDDMADCGTDSRREQTCSDTCAWVSSGPCTDLCGDTARTTPADATEICIPAGPFIRGGMGTTLGTGAGPIGEVRLSAYYVDKFPATNERYSACVTAGACTLPRNPDFFTDPTRARYPVQGLSWNQAMQFCAWDGGRRLPTEAEWEKAARGPSPRNQAFLWGDTYDCTALYSGPCGYVYTGRMLPDPIDGLPGTRSYYGTEMMVGGGYEYTADYYAIDYYTDPTSYDDPTGPATGTDCVVRGFPRSATPTTYDYFAVWSRRRGPLTAQGETSVVRCARTP